jgi:hypothetical protein
MNSDWQLITETIDGARTTTAYGSSDWGGWETLQAQPGTAGALEL